MFWWFVLGWVLSLSQSQDESISSSPPIDNPTPIILILIGAIFGIIFYLFGYAFEYNLCDCDGLCIGSPKNRNEISIKLNNN